MTTSQRMHGRAKAQAWLQVATEAVRLYGHDDAVPFTALAADLATEIALLEALEAARAPHQRRREQLYRQVDPTLLARTLPGIAEVGGPLATAIVGRAGRFPDADHFASYTGLVPGASETGTTDRKGQPITKAGNRKLRRMLYRAADTARKQDPSWPAATGSRWSSGAPTTPRPWPWSPPTWPADCGASWNARPPTWSATSTVDPSPRPGQAGHRRALHRPRGHPPPATLPQAGGEGPSPSPQGTCGQAKHTRAPAARGDLPQPPSSPPPQPEVNDNDLLTTEGA